MNQPGRLLRPEEQHDQRRAQNSKSGMFEKQQIGIKVQGHEARGDQPGEQESDHRGLCAVFRSHVWVMCKRMIRITSRFPINTITEQFYHEVIFLDHTIVSCLTN